MTKCGYRAILSAVKAKGDRIVSTCELPEGFRAHPSMFAVENEYQIMLLVDCEALISVRVGENEYFDDVNGICRSATELHRVCVPMARLDAAKEYTIRFRKVIARKAYFSETEAVEEYTYSFCPLEKETDIRIYHIADTHGYVNTPVAAALAAGRPDLLVFNGDIADSSNTVEQMLTVYFIASGVAKGELPCVFSRGNHDLRGKSAERLADYCPNHNGCSYYTFRVGCLWGVVLDCGEDKPDASNEYGNTVACHPFRVRETEFIKSLSGYNDPSVRYRLVLCHVPFTQGFAEPFNIEIPLYTEWAKILKETVKPHLMLCGHLHICEVVRPGEPRDVKGQPCPVVVASRPSSFDGNTEGHIGTLITLNSDHVTVVCNDNNGTIGLQDTISL